MATKALLNRLDDLEQQAYAKTGGATSSVIGVCGADGKPVRCYRLVDRNPVQVDEPAEILIPEKLEAMLTHNRYVVLYGGRGSGKTRSIVAYLVERARTSFERILCAREIQKSIQDSSYQELVDEINRRGLEDEFKVLETKITHRVTGSTFSFEGLYRNVTKIKGYAGATVVWVEEGENISQKSWDILSPTIRAKGSQIMVSFNPALEEDPTYQLHVAPYVDKMVDGVYVGDNHTAININHTDNPWMTDELRMERDKMRRTDMDRYMWIWEGQFFSHGDAQIFSGKWTVEDFDIEDFGSKKKGPRFLPEGPYFGTDFGYSQDPTTLVRCWVWNSCLYVDYAIAKVGLDIVDMGEFYLKVPESDQHAIWGDSSRPETIAHLQKNWKDESGKIRPGFRIRACTKWAGSIEDGIAHIRSYDRVIIHPRCKPLIFEMSNYKYKVDPLTDEVTNKIVDKHNHSCDALRYSLETRIGGKRSGYKGWL